jgi:hypothetical protein
MGVYKKYNGERLKNAKDKNWSRGTWYVWKRIRGRVIHRALPEAQTKADAENAERELVTRAFNRRYGILDDTLFADFANTTLPELLRQKNRERQSQRSYTSASSSPFRIDAAARHHAADAPRSAMEIAAAAKARERQRANALGLVRKSHNVDSVENIHARLRRGKT